MVVGQWIGLVVDRNKGLYPVTAVVVQGHRQPLHLLWQCGKLSDQQRQRVHALAERGAIALSDSITYKLMRDGMYLAGLDIAGDKMMEINVDTPGGITMADDLTGIDFSGVVIEDLQRKVELRNHYNGTLTNTELAMM